MAVTIVPITVSKAIINSENNLELGFNTRRKDTASITEENYKPLRLAVDNQYSFICKNEESSNSTKFESILYNTSESHSSTTGIYTRQYDVRETLDLSASAFTPESDLLFVYIYSQDGASGHSTVPEYLEAVVPVYNEKNILDKVFNAIKKDFSGCDKECKEYTTSAYAVNLYNGFKYALSTGDYRAAIMFWNKLNNCTTSTTSGCNCH